MHVVCFSKIFQTRAPNAILKVCRRLNTFQLLRSPEVFTRNTSFRSNGNFHKIKFCQPQIQKHQCLLSNTSSKGKADSKDVLVYQGQLQTKIKVVKIISLSSSMLAFAMQPIILYDIGKVNLGVSIIVGVVSTFFLATPLFLNYITKRYVVELHFNPETKVFTAKTLNIVNQIKEIKFTATDVIVPDLPGMLSSFVVNKIPLFVDANTVEDPDAYSHMMGYDKPLDLLVHDILEKNQSKEDTKK